MCQGAPVKCHVSCVTFPFFNKVAKPLSGGYVINKAYPVQFSGEHCYFLVQIRTSGTNENFLCMLVLTCIVYKLGVSFVDNLYNIKKSLLPFLSNIFERQHKLPFLQVKILFYACQNWQIWGQMNTFLYILHNCVTFQYKLLPFSTYEYLLVVMASV